MPWHHRDSTYAWCTYMKSRKYAQNCAVLESTIVWNDSGSFGIAAQPLLGNESSMDGGRVVMVRGRWSVGRSVASRSGGSAVGPWIDAGRRWVEG